ncbi:MAG: autotransporter outer membrane beta-barrel domain-containing protein, partial [Abditibacteriaceae bacterium]
TTTTFGSHATFAPSINLTSGSYPGHPDPAGLLRATNLTLNNSLLQPHWNAANNIAVNQTFDVLHYNGAQSGIFNPTVVSPLTFDTTYTGSSNADVLLQLTGVNYTHVGGDENQRSLESYLNNFYSNNGTTIILDPTGNLAPGINLAQLTSDLSNDGASALNNLIHDEYSQQNVQTYWSQQAFINSIADNLRNDRNMGAGGATSFALNQTNVSSTGMQLSSLRQAMTSIPGGLGMASDVGNSSTGVWAGYTGAHQHTDADSGIGSSDWNSSSDGFVLGYTGGGEKFSWGFAAGHQKSTFDSSNSTGNQEGYNAGLYASWKSKSTYLNAVLGYGKYDNSVYGGSEANFDTHGMSAYLELGKRLKDDSKGGLSPYASVLWTRIKNGSANDSNGFNLESGSNNIYTTALGLRYNHRMFDKGDTLKGGWTAGLAWLHQFGDTAFPVNGNYSSTSPFSFQTESTPLSGNAAQVQLGAYGRIHGNLIGFAGYQGTFGSNQKINGVDAGVGYQF